MDYQALEQLEVTSKLLEDDVWDERLLSTRLFPKLQRLLRGREFFILEELVNSTEPEALAELLGIKLNTLRWYRSQIKKMIVQGYRADSEQSKIFSQKRKYKNGKKKSKHSRK